MEALMQLQIITPDRLMCDESVKMVEMRTAEGEIGVLPGHIPVTVMMAPGVTHITKADGSIRHIAIHDGFVKYSQTRSASWRKLPNGQRKSIWIEQKLRFPVRESVSLIQVRIRILPAQDVHGPVPQLELNYLPVSGSR